MIDDDLRKRAAELFRTLPRTVTRGDIERAVNGHLSIVVGATDSPLPEFGVSPLSLMPAIGIDHELVRGIAQEAADKELLTLKGPRTRSIVTLGARFSDGTVYFNIRIGSLDDPKFMDDYMAHADKQIRSGDRE